MIFFVPGNGIKKILTKEYLSTLISMTRYESSVTSKKRVESKKVNTKELNAASKE